VSPRTKELGALLYNLMKARGLNCARLAFQAQIGRSTLWRAFHGRCTLRPDTLRLVLNVLRPDPRERQRILRLYLSE
jgi:predicted transcriptional regulator